MNRMLATILMLPLALLPCRAQTNVIFGYMADLQMTPTAGTAVTMSLISPNPKIVNGIWFSPQPITTYTDANGYYKFQNVSWGEYEWDIQGQALVGYVGINTVGSNNVVALTTNTYAFIVNGQGVTNFVATNFWGSSGTMLFYNADTNGAAAAAGIATSNGVVTYMAASGTAANANYANSAGSAALATTAITASNLTAGAAQALTNGYETAAHAAATYYPTSNPSGFISSVPSGATNQFAYTNDTRSISHTNPANQFAGTFTGNGSGLTNLPASGGGVTNGGGFTLWGTVQGGTNGITATFLDPTALNTVTQAVAGAIAALPVVSNYLTSASDLSTNTAGGNPLISFNATNGFVATGFNPTSFNKMWYWNATANLYTNSFNVNTITNNAGVWAMLLSGATPRFVNSNSVVGNQWVVQGGVTVGYTFPLIYSSSLLYKYNSGVTNGLSGASSVAIVFSYPYQDTNYSVSMTGEGAALVAPYVTGKTNTGCTLNFTAFTGNLEWSATHQ